ncbi:2-phospho-L-lactate guanylyltransferase [BD1-7 clade bacterium]|uniref:2-phospho-L-lactate guanylyltransferase n=1 Tax=BD1-7 clade bacterium TaxID=2029982 RepID=A0A5S9QBL2_9GAMM|nr:2-phospho-L-lactate guanylyltransferase [BD1-7 clade bacterium]
MPTDIATLVIFCKRPRLGQGKQRLTRHLAADDVLKIANALLDCTLEDAANWPGPVVLAVSEPEDRRWGETIMPINATCIAQPTGNLGDRLQGVDRQLRQQGHQRTITIGTDAPALNLNTLFDIDQQLTHKDIVLMPADDGGVVAMANRHPWPPLTHLPWSTATLGDSLAQACIREGLHLSHTRSGFDVDELHDLQHLQYALQADTRPARCQLLTLLNHLLPVIPAGSRITPRHNMPPK